MNNLKLTNENRNLVLDVTDQNHATNNIWSRALLVDQGESCVQVIGNRGGALGATSIGRNNDAVFCVEVLSDVAEERRFGVEVVYRHTEETCAARSSVVDVHRYSSMH